MAVPMHSNRPNHIPKHKLSLQWISYYINSDEPEGLCTIDSNVVCTRVNPVDYFENSNSTTVQIVDLRLRDCSQAKSMVKCALWLKTSTMQMDHVPLYVQWTLLIIIVSYVFLPPTCVRTNVRRKIPLIKRSQIYPVPSWNFQQKEKKGEKKNWDNGNKVFSPFK